MEHLKQFVTGKLKVGRKAYFQSIISLQGSQCAQVPRETNRSNSVGAANDGHYKDTLSSEAMKHTRYSKFRLVELE